MVFMTRRERSGGLLEASAGLLKASAMAMQRVLVVDDEEDLLELIRYNLCKEGFHVRCVASGEAAIAEARSYLPDVILLDLMLPAVDGLGFVRR